TGVQTCALPIWEVDDKVPEPLTYRGGEEVLHNGARHDLVELEFVVVVLPVGHDDNRLVRSGRRIVKVGSLDLRLNVLPRLERSAPLERHMSGEHDFEFQLEFREADEDASAKLVAERDPCSRERHQGSGVVAPNGGPGPIEGVSGRAG